ncbi:MAG TPA: sigma-54 dependent transcriptional regulator [Bacteroidota bacterium]|nr:sigma-54 dependent transcriptional regulator [Bacteroidota bacterium]
MVRHRNILIVDDEPSIGFLLKEDLSEGTPYAVTTVLDGAQALNALQTMPFEVVLLDVKMPRMSGMEVLKHISEHYPTTCVIMLSNYADVKTAIEATKLGAYDFIGKPYSREELLATVARALEHRRLLLDNEAMKYELSRQSSVREIIANSAAMKAVLATVARVGESDAIVHIFGPSGSGKELIAHQVHSASLRRDSPFVILNCASIPDSLLESELFGHEKGSFTNAYATKQGLVEVAGGGTLFLDEVGDISPAIQPKLLRFLETGEFRRVGGTVNLKTDVRILSATNKDLQQEVAAGRFREDLLYRLNVVTLRIPPLKERKDDIPALVEYFLTKKIKMRTPKTISPDALMMLVEYDWPGNIRELEHAIQGAALLAPGDVITSKDFTLHSFSLRAGQSAASETGDSLMTLDEMERIHIEHMLQKFHFNRTRAANALGITAKTLYLKIKKYNIAVPQE